MEDSIVLDTDVLVDIIREKPEINKWVKENEDKYVFATTIINIFELYAGAYKDVNKEKKLIIVENLKERLKILDFDIRVAQLAGKIRVSLEDEGNPIEIRDLFIGSIVLLNNLPIKTNNKKHFSKIDGLKVL